MEFAPRQILLKECDSSQGGASPQDPQRHFSAKYAEAVLSLEDNLAANLRFLISVASRRWQFRNLSLDLSIRRYSGVEVPTL